MGDVLVLLWYLFVASLGFAGSNYFWSLDTSWGRPVGGLLFSLAMLMVLIIYRLLADIIDD